MVSAGVMLSVFIRDPQFQGQTKERLSTPEAARLVETSVRDHFDHWLSAAPDMAEALLEAVVERAELRLRRRQDRQMKRQSATRPSASAGQADRLHPQHRQRHGDFHRRG